MKRTLWRKATKIRRLIFDLWNFSRKTLIFDAALQESTYARVLVEILIKFYGISRKPTTEGIFKVSKRIGGNILGLDSNKHTLYSQYDTI